MRLILHKLKLVNFKGQRDLEVDFNPSVTTITGDNGLGKSTLLAAFSWLFTGKDQFNQADLNKIKTWDKNKKHIEKISHSVEGELTVDDRPITLKRVLVQNWVKRRGETNTVLDGHTTEYYINGVGCGTETAFKQELSKIIDENTFKLLTNPVYFNEILEWKERREILFNIMPPLTDDEVIELITNDTNKNKVASLRDVLNAGAPFERYKKELAARKKQKNEQLFLIPAKIEATERTKPEVPDGGFGIIEHQIKKIQSEINDLDVQISDKSKANEAILKQKREKQQIIHNLKTALQNAKNASDQKRKSERSAILDKISEIENKIRDKERSITSFQSDIDSNLKQITSLEDRKKFAEERGPELEKRKEELKKEFFKVDSLQFEFDPNSQKCPTCGTPLTGTNLEEKREHLEAEFNKNKSDKLDQIDAQGLTIKKDVEQYQSNIKEFSDRIEKLIEENLTISEKQSKIKDEIIFLQEDKKVIDQQLSNFDSIKDILESEEEKQLKEQIEKTDQKEENNEENSNSELIAQKSEKQRRLDDFKNIYSHKEQIEKTDKLLAEYTDEERKLAQEVADIEKEEDIMNEFSRTRIESIEQNVNNMFQLVTFKLFHVNLNREERECCEAIEPNGTPAADTNTAMKINCGLDIINVLSNHYNIFLPVFIDNRESVSEILPINTQIINLEKIKGQKTLKVE